MESMYYSAVEVAKREGVSWKTIIRWAKEGKLIYKKIGRDYKFPKEGYEAKSS